MGTSNSYGGAGGATPLIPSWLGPESGEDAGEAPTIPAQEEGEAGPENAPSSGGLPTPQTLTPLPTPGDSNRFTAARSNFTRFVTSGGQDRRAFGRALSSYVGTSMGGGGSAAQRMAPSRHASSRLANFLSTAAAAGVQEALRSVGLERLAGRSIGEVLRGLTDFLCPPGGSIDESIARDAFIETLADLAASGIYDLDTLTPEQMQTVLELNIAHAIETRICNDIGTNSVALPASPEAAADIQEQLFEFVRGSVTDAFSAAPLGQGLTSQETQQAVDRIYGQAFGILKSLAEAEVDQ